MITSPLNLSPGALLDCINFVPDIVQGYTSFQGYERVDGQDKPSDMSYWIVGFTDGETEPSIGDTVTGVASGKTGVVLSAPAVESGSWDDNDAAGSFFLTRVDGSFTDDEELQVAGLKIAVADGIGTQGGYEPTDIDTHQDMLHSAVDAQRDNINAVPGSGDILGTFIFNGIMYAFRNNEEETEACLYKEDSTTGWTQIEFGKTLYFTDGGTYEPSKDETVTGDVSGATANIDRVIVQSGSWSDGDAAGYLVISSQAGTFEAEDLDIGGEFDIATVSGDSSDITLSTDGFFRFITFNFYGVEEYEEIYFADGVNKAHAFDGTTLTPIDTGMEAAGHTDAPTHLTVHKNYLYLAFDGGSLQRSSLGNPVTVNGVTGADEIGLGENITGLAALPGDAFAGLCRNQTWLFFGTPDTDFTQKRHASDTGAIDKSVQLVAGQLIYLDDQGITTLAATEKFGNFISNSLSRAVQPFIDGQKNSVVCSTVIPSRNQYILFFNNQTAACFFIADSLVQAVTILHLEHQVSCAYTGEDASGNEIALIGCEDGHVRQLYSGYDMDGTAFDGYIRLPYYHYKTPRRNKRFTGVTVENTVDGVLPVTIKLLVDFNYGASSVPISVAATSTSATKGGFWSGLKSYGEFYYDQPLVSSEISSYIQGVGYNMSILVTRPKENAWSPPITLSGCIIEFINMGKTGI